VNSGRLGLLLFLIVLPFTLPLLKNWAEIHTWTLRRISAIALLIWILSAFNPSVILVVLGIVAYSATRDFLAANKNFKDALFIQRAIRYATLLLAPLLLSAPGSFEYFVRPNVLMSEIGFTVAGGGPNLALMGNPGGPGSLPWWCISPITVVLMVTYFSSTAARKFATPGVVFLLSGCARICTCHFRKWIFIYHSS